MQDLTLEIPEAPAQRIAPAPLVPGVRDFVDAAMNTARDLARAAAAAGIPQRFTSVELTAKITRSTQDRRRHHGDDPRLGASRRVGAEDLARTRDEDNTVRLLFEAPGPRDRAEEPPGRKKSGPFRNRSLPSRTREATS